MSINSTNYKYYLFRINTFAQLYIIQLLLKLLHGANFNVRFLVPKKENTPIHHINNYIHTTILLNVPILTVNITYSIPPNYLISFHNSPNTAPIICVPPCIITRLIILLSPFKLKTIRTLLFTHLPLRSNIYGAMRVSTLTIFHTGVTNTVPSL
jgi:hypothetical protein